MITEKQKDNTESLDDFFDKVEEETPKPKPRIHNAADSTCISCEG